MENRDLNERIRHEAYLLWLEDGCPHGRDEVHWHQAEQVILGIDAQRAAAETAGRKDEAKAR